MLYFPDTQPTQPLITTACQPFPAVATHAKVSPFFAAVMRLYCVPLPVRMLTVPLTQEIVTCLPAGVYSPFSGSEGFSASSRSAVAAISAAWVSVP